MPVRSIIPSLKLEDYLSVQAHKPCSTSHLEAYITTREAGELESFTINNSVKSQGPHGRPVCLFFSQESVLQKKKNNCTKRASGSY